MTSLLTFWQTWPARVLHSHSLSERPHRRLDLTLPVSDDLVAEKFWTPVERSHDPMCSRPLVSPARKRVTIITANVLTMHPAQAPDSDPSLFSGRRLQLSLCFEGKMAHLVGVQESRCRETSIRSFRGYTILSSAARPLGQCGCELWVSSNVATIKDLCLLHADPRKLMVTLPLHGSTSLATVVHAPDRHHVEDAISVWWQETLDLLKRLCPSGIPVIAMTDANAEVGSEVSPFIGNKDAAQETFSGGLLHRFCADLLLTLPATHHEPTFCPDGGSPIWSHTTGNWRRIDFVALPLHWLSACSNVHTWQHGELALQDREDHRTASVDVSLQLP